MYIHVTLDPPVALAAPLFEALFFILYIILPTKLLYLLYFLTDISSIYYKKVCLYCNIQEMWSQI